MFMSEITVQVKKKGHANLDSFPFRYGFSCPENFHLIIQYNSKPIEQIANNGKKRLKIDGARFVNPTNLDQILRGNFVISEANSVVITVIREDEGVEKTLSKALTIFRKFKYVQVNELIDYFHPIYINGDIKTHQDFKRYWIEKYSTDLQKISEMEDVVAKAFKKLDKVLKELEKEKADHGLTRKELKKERTDHGLTKEELQEKEVENQKLRMQLDSINDNSISNRPVTTRPGRILINATLEDMNTKNRGLVQGVILYFDDGTILKNNWDGAEKRKEVVSQLIGREVRTDVWGSYSASEWFRNVYLV